MTKTKIMAMATMPPPGTPQHKFRDTIMVGMAWFVSSAVLSTWANTAFLNEFESVLGHTFVRFVGAALLSAMALGPSAATRHLETGIELFSPVAVCLFCANLLNSVALVKTGITLTYVVKSAIPVLTVLLCAIQGERFPVSIYLSLIPTVIGVALASASDVSFDPSGLIAAIGSAMAQTLLNVMSKKASEATGVNGFPAFFVMCSFASLLATVAFILVPSEPVFVPAYQALVGPAHDIYPALLIIMAAAAYQIEYGLNFVFSSYVDPLTFSVADIARRLAIILVGTAIFDKELTLLNIAGIGLALVGVLSYNLLNQHLQRQATKAQPKSRN